MRGKGRQREMVGEREVMGTGENRLCRGLINHSKEVSFDSEMGR